MDDGIIDLTSYGRGPPEEEGGSFALWGAEGERSRLALPVWRSIFLLDGDRGALGWSDVEGGELRPFFVLDLREEPARTDLDDVDPGDAADEVPPALRVARGTAAVLLGRDRGRVWWLVVTGPDVDGSGLDARKREDLLFLAGECAGLLTRRGLADDAGK